MTWMIVVVGLGFALVGLALIAASLWVHSHAIEQFSHMAAEARSAGREQRLHLTTRIETLEDRLLSHSWDTYAGLRSEVPGTPDRVANVEAREQAWGTEPTTEHDPEDVLRDYMQSSGMDLEGGTVG